MPKGTKLTALPKLDEWKAPWEVKRDDEGNEIDIPAEEQKIDPAQLKRYLHGLLSDKINFRNQVEELSAEAEAQQQALANAKTPEELKALQEENARLVKERDEAKEKAKSGANALKWEIALEKGLTKTQAKRLVGATREELEADADELIAEFGHRGTSNDDGESGVRRAPRRRLQSGNDDNHDDNHDDKELDYDAIVRGVLANR